MTRVRYCFDCKHCHGGWGIGPCSIRRQYERKKRLEAQNNEEKVVEHFENSKDHDEKYHVHCKGNRFCYSREVVVQAGDNVILNCHYSSYGYAIVGNTDHKVYNGTLSSYFDRWKDVKLVADEFVCVDCYEDLESNLCLKNEIDPTVPDDSEYKQKHAAYVLNSKFNIPLPVIEHHIMPYLNNCLENKDRYDCLLCSAILTSHYFLPREELTFEREETNEENTSQHL